jgi:hypothetical protein
MAAVPPESRPQIPKWVIIAALTCFLTVWISAMIAGLSFGGCVERPLTDSRKLAYCNTSIVAGTLIDLFPTERAKRAPLLLERGIIRATSGEHDAAKRDFAKALLDAAEVRSDQGIAFPRDVALPRVAPLFAAIQRQAADSIATVLWFEVVRDLACGHPETSSPELCGAN